MTARNIAPPRPRARRNAYAPRGRTTTVAAPAAQPAHDGGPGGPKTSARRAPSSSSAAPAPEGGEPVGQAAAPGGGVVGQVGQHVGEVRPAAQQRARRDQPGGRRR